MLSKAKHRIEEDIEKCCLLPFIWHNTM